MNRTEARVRIVFAGLFVVTAAFIPVRAHALEDFTSPRNADVDARGAKSVLIEASAGSSVSKAGQESRRRAYQAPRDRASETVSTTSS